MVLSSSSFPQQKIQGFKGILMLASWCCVWALQEGSFGALKSESCMPAWLSAPISCICWCFPEQSGLFQLLMV